LRAQHRLHLVEPQQRGDRAAPQQPRNELRLDVAHRRHPAARG